LGLDRVGINDGFFELGGDSLLAMQVLNRTREIAGVPVAFRDLFEHGTIAGLAGQLGHPARREDRPLLGATRGDNRTAYPLSRSQQGVWFLWQLEPENPYYTAQGTIHLRGKLDINGLVRAWEAVIDRHEILRTRFAMQDGEPVQVFDDRRSTALPLVDLTHLPEADRLPQMHALARVKGERALDLEKDPLLQSDLFKLGPEHHELLITFHEIILDLWGISVIVRDLGELYQGFMRGDDEPLPPPPVGFGDYVLWERERVRREMMAGEAAFWREQLAGELPVLNLPTDRLRSSTLAYRGGARSIMLDAELTRALKTLSTRSNATLFMTLVAASYVLLRAYSGQDDVILGSPIANRTDEQTEQLVGFFLNMLPLRATLADDPTFEELLGQVRHTVTGAITHAEYPFMWMAEETRTARDTSVAPVFQVMFNMLNLPHTSYECDDLSLSFSEVDTGYTKYDMSWYAQEHGDQLFFQIAYLTELFDADTVDRMVRNFEILLRNAVEDPQKPISALGVLTEAERHRVLQTFNETDRDFPTESCIHELFEQQAARTPDATALLFEGVSCTYAQLNARANQLAWHLRSLGIGSGSPVGLCVSRSFDTLVTILAVMKAGGTYVALEPTYPMPRLAAMLRDAEPAVLLVHKQWSHFDGYSGIKVVLEDEAEVLAEQSEDNLPTITTPDSVLNVVYTSASTGTPKGTLITMRAVLNRLWWMWEDHPFRAGDVALLQKSYALVAATWECFGGLLQGIPTVILSQDESFDPAAIWRRLVDHGVTHVLASPPFFEGILDQAEQDPSEWRTVRFASTSAEPIPASMVARWRRAFPDVSLLNLYGSTECSSNVTAYDTSELPLDAERVPVGRPLPNTRVYVVDDHLRPVPLGAVGEMCVSGACLAAGYLNLLSLTREHFVSNPYGDGSYARLFRTGDLARYRVDGQLELIGRRDHQVKIRGFRVELADIEEALRRHDDVQRCAVALWDLDGRKRLVAYVVREHEVTQATLWRFLRERLPDYMVPAHFVFLDSIPVTPNGKIDRTALPVPEVMEGSAGTVAPRTATEDIVHRLWREVLGVEHFGVEENFFELGGHSLLATRLVSQLREWFQLEMPVRALFEHPTVAGVAEFLAGEVGGYAVLEEIARTLLEVVQLSDDEVREQLANPRADRDE
jgi:surfactin family lipopeptide synthetase A